MKNEVKRWNKIEKKAYDFKSCKKHTFKLMNCN